MVPQLFQVGLWAAPVQNHCRCRKQTDRQSQTIAKPVLIAFSLTLSSCASLFGSFPALAQKTTQLSLDSALCDNNWSGAIGIISALVADARTSSRDRAALLNWRDQLAEYRAENLIVPQLEACDRAEPYQLDARAASTDLPARTTGWEAALAAASQGELSTHIATESVPFSLPVEVESVAGLTPASPVDLRGGLNVVSGQVGTGHNVYSFVARLGDSVTADLNVTQVMAGTLYTSDDSQLFIFDSAGKLLAIADDVRGRQARISDFVVPKTGVYFAVVTSYNNDPMLTRDDHLAGWQDNGGGKFDYTLTLMGATSTNALAKDVLVKDALVKK